MSTAEYSREYYAKNRERLLRQMRERDPEGRWEYNIKRWYGIDSADYYRILEEQGGGCAICGSPTPGAKRCKKFHIDHEHETGIVRGILCSYCNLLLGNAKEEPERLEAAAAYLRKSR